MAKQKEAKSLPIEEVRQRRLAYFQSSSRENLSERQLPPKPGSEKASLVKAPPDNPKVKKDGGDVHADKKISRSGANRPGGQGTTNPPKSGSHADAVLSGPIREMKPSKEFDDILSKDWNSHVEQLFRKGQQNVVIEQNQGGKSVVRESQDFEAVSMFKSEADCNDLGLSTHRPESERTEGLDRNQNNSVAFLEENLSQEMKALLGESKYKEFVEKSVKDINELYHHKTTETSPHLIKSLLDDQTRHEEVKPDDPNLPHSSSGNRAGSPRHRLNRPRKEPVHIQNLVTKTKRDLELEGSDAMPGTSRNYEQVTVSRNVTFSADEIYRQAYRFSANPYEREMVGQQFGPGMPFGPGVMMNMPPPPAGFQGHPHGFPPDVSQPPPGHFMYPGQIEMYTPRSPTTPTSPQNLYYPPPYRGDPNFPGFIDPNYQMAYQNFGNVYQPYPFANSGFAPHYPNYPPAPVHMPHPPPQHQGIRFQQYPPGPYDPGQQLLQRVPHPPPDRIDPEREVMEVETHKADPHEKIQKVNVPKQPPSVEDAAVDGAVPQERHIKEIREHHEQRRQMQEDKMNEVIHLEKQKKFAQASLDRYFSSLENVYQGPKIDQQPLPKENAENVAEAQNVAEDDAFTNVTATSIQAGGITERLEKLGIEVPLLKPAGSTSGSDSHDADKQKKRKKVKICPGCSSVNKDYMSWCADCGEILIGVEAKRKEKKGKLADKDEPKVELDRKTSSPVNRRNVCRSPEILSYRNDEDLQISVTKPSEMDVHVQQLEKVKKELDVPNFGDVGSYLRTPQEINDLCEVISDPVIRGFIKNYFSRKAGSTQPAAQEDKNDAVEEELCDKTPKSTGENDLSDGEVILNLKSSIDSHPKNKNYVFKDHGEIDVEIFGIEENRHCKLSSRSPQVVPSLDLYDSSDDEEVLAARRKALRAAPVSMSVDTDAWSSVAGSVQMGPEGDALPVKQEVPPPAMEESFLAQILAMRSEKPKRQRPQSADLLERKRTGQSIVKESIEAEPYQRHWEKSSIAWSSYHPRELNTRSSLRTSMLQDPRIQVSNNAENLQSGTRRMEGKSHPGVHTFKKVRPASADFSRRKVYSGNNRPTSAQVRGSRSTSQDVPEETSAPNLSPSQTNNIAHRLPPEEKQPHVLQGPVSAMTAYSKYMEMTPRIEEGEFSKWQCLPDEIWLYVFAYLNHSDQARTARVCKQFYRIAVDETLWKYVTLKKNDGICDEWLGQIAKRHPVSLAIIQCHGDNVTSKGLRELFRECADCLKELNFSRCSRGGLTGDSILLHASARCRNLTHVDASWCHVTDNGLTALSECAHRLESLCLNGCQMLSDDGMETVIVKHGARLRVLEMFGCFNITPKTIRCLATHCTYLNTLNLGQCFRLTDSSITHLSASLGRIENLDLRGCKQIRDNCIRKIVRNCPRLKTITVANCPHISDAALIEIATYATDIRSIDICGCRNVTDQSIRTLANNCQRLSQLDISSSGCSHHSVLLLANFCNRSLETLKLNFLADITEQSLQKLVKHCKKLKTLHLYGCTSVRSVERLKQLCPFLHVEM